MSDKYQVTRPDVSTARFFVRGAALLVTAALAFGLAAAATAAAAASCRDGMWRSKKAKLAAMCSQVAAW